MQVISLNNPKQLLLLYPPSHTHEGSKIFLPGSTYTKFQPSKHQDLGRRANKIVAREANHTRKIAAVGHGDVQMGADAQLRLSLLVTSSPLLHDGLRVLAHPDAQGSDFNEFIFLNVFYAVVQTVLQW